MHPFLDWLPNWLLEWGKDLLMVGVAGAGLWGVIQHKAKTHLYPSEYEREVLNDLKELRQLLEWQIMQKPWLEEKSEEQRAINSYKAQDESFLWNKLYKDWIQGSKCIECHTTKEVLDAINESIRLIQKHGIGKAQKIRRGEITDLYQMIMRLRKEVNVQYGDGKGNRTP